MVRSRDHFVSKGASGVSKGRPDTQKVENRILDLQGTQLGDQMRTCFLNLVGLFSDRCFDNGFG